MMSKFKYLLGAVLLGTILFGVPAFAAGLTIDFEQTPLFAEGNFMPGNDVARYIKVTNTSGETKPIAMEFINYSDPDGLGAQLIFSIEENSTPLYAGTVADFHSQGEYYLSDLATGNNTQYDLIVSFQPSAGNDYQEKALGFDIIIGFEGEEGGGGGGGGGAVIIPGLTITNETEYYCEDPPCDYALITWHTSYKSTSQVIYSVEGGDHTLNLGEPNFGYENAHPIPEDDTKVTFHEVELFGLEPCTTYYYRAVSHASPPTIGTQQIFETCCPETGEPEPEPEIPPAGPGPTTPITPPIEEPTPPTEEPTVEGEPEPEPEIEEEPEQQANLLANLASLLKNLSGVCYECFPWWVILFFAIHPLIRSYLAWKRKKKDKWNWTIWTLLHAVLALVMYFLYFCPALWFYGLLALLNLGMWRLYAKEEKRRNKILLIGLIFILAYLILVLIMGCAYIWLILFLVLLFTAIANTIRGKTEKEEKAEGHKI